MEDHIIECSQEMAASSIGWLTRNNTDLDATQLQQLQYAIQDAIMGKMREFYRPKVCTACQSRAPRWLSEGGEEHLCNECLLERVERNSAT